MDTIGSAHSLFCMDWDWGFSFLLCGIGLVFRSEHENLGWAFRS